MRRLHRCEFTRAVAATVGIGLAAMAADARARDLFPDNPGSRELKYAEGSRTVLLPNPPWTELMWRLHWGNNVTEPGIAYFNFDIRVVTEPNKPNAKPHLEVSFDGQSSFDHSPPCRAKPPVEAILFSKAGDRIQPTFRFEGDIYKHDAGKHFSFRSPDIESYRLDQIGRIVLRVGQLSADCGD